MKRLLTIFFLFTAFFASATNYYFTPIRPLSEANALSLHPGDSVLFQRGGYWKGVFNPNGSGTVGFPIYVGAFGEGANPIINTRDTVPGWSVQANWHLVTGKTDVWRFDLPSSANVSHRIWLNGIEWARAKDSSQISATRRATHLTDYLKLWVYATTNPALYYSSIEYTTEATGTINLYNRNNYVIENLDVRGASGGSIDLNTVTNITIKNCIVGLDANRIGIRSFDRADSVFIFNNTIISGDRIQDYFLYQNGVADGIALSTGCHYWKVYNNRIEDWGHSGIEFTDVDGVVIGGVFSIKTASVRSGYTMSHVEVYNNKIKGVHVDYMRGLGVDSRKDHSTTDVRFHDNWVDSCSIRTQIQCRNLEFDHNRLTHTRNCALPELASGNGQALMIAGYSGTDPSYMNIHHNVFAYSAEAGLTLSYATGYNPHDSNRIHHNVFAFNGSDGSFYGLTGVQIVVQPFSDGYNMGPNIIDSNLLFSNVSSKLFYSNLYSGTAQYKSIVQMNAANTDYGNIIHDNISLDPLFNEDFTFQDGSPAALLGFAVGTIVPLKPVVSMAVAIRNGKMVQLLSGGKLATISPRPVDSSTVSNYLNALYPVNYNNSFTQTAPGTWVSYGSDGLDAAKNFTRGTPVLYLATYKPGNPQATLALDSSSSSLTFGSHQYFVLPDSTAKLITGENTYETYGYFDSPVLESGDTYGFQVEEDGTVTSIVVHAGTKILIKPYPIKLSATATYYLHGALGPLGNALWLPKSNL